MMELVSIITPLYNAENSILDTATSIFNQTYKNWEWIIINDCSSDSSRQLVENELIQKDKRVILINNEKNIRTALSRNRGIDAAKGRFLCFLDSDDIWHPLKLEKQIKFMTTNNYAFTYHSYQKLWGSFVGAPIPVPDKVSYSNLLQTNSIACLSAMYDTKMIGKFFMPDGYKAREDFLCWLQILKKIDFAYGINESLGYYRISSNSYSSNKLEVAKLQWGLYRNFEKLSLPSACLNFVLYSLHGYLKNKVI